MNELKERLKISIEKSKYNKSEIAKILGIEKSNISNWINGTGKPSLEVFYKLCILLDESSDYLLGLDTKSNKELYIEEFEYTDGIHQIKHKKER